MYFNGDIYLEDKYRFTFFIGEKSIGKTTWGLNRVKKRYEDEGVATAWIFNTLDEVKAFLKKEVIHNIDPLKHYLKGRILYDRKNGTIIAVFGSVKNPQDFKNVQHVKMLIFDEIENRTGELNKNIVFENFIKILSNSERKKKGFEIFAFMNAETKNNAIMQGMDLKFDWTKEVNYYPEYELKIVMIPKNIYFSDEERENSLANKLGRANKKLYEMAFQNQFSYDDDRMIDWQHRNIISKPLYHLNYSEQKFSVFINIDKKLYFDYKRDFVYNVKTLSLTLMDFFMNQDNRYKDNEREYDSVYLQWEAHINNDTVLFKDYYIKETIIDFLARRRSIIDGG